MRRTIRWIVDFAAIWSGGVVIWDAYGSGAGAVAMALIAMYGIWCFWDGGN